MRMHRTRRDGAGVVEEFPATELEARIARQFKRRERTSVYEDGHQVARVFKTDEGRWTWWYENRSSLGE